MFAKDVPADMLDAVAVEFGRSFTHSRESGRPRETYERHEDFWRGTGELYVVLETIREFGPIE